MLAENLSSKPRVNMIIFLIPLLFHAEGAAAADKDESAVGLHASMVVSKRCVAVRRTPAHLFTNIKTVKIKKSTQVNIVHLRRYDYKLCR